VSEEYFQDQFQQGPGLLRVCRFLRYVYLS
jgi:hypothetical protein